MKEGEKGGGTCSKRKKVELGGWAEELWVCDYFKNLSLGQPNGPKGERESEKGKAKI